MDGVQRSEFGVQRSRLGVRDYRKLDAKNFMTDLVNELIMRLMLANGGSN
jgi:hypothetical protein